jgi:serine/threonine-protein kinase
MHGLEREPDARFTRAEDLGVALGEAASAAWGSDWLDHIQVPILGSQAIAVAARTGVPAGAPSPGDAEGATGGGAAAPSLSVVRAGGPRIAGLDLNRLAGGDLVDIEDLVNPPPPPRRATIVAGALALVMLVVALVGIGSPHRSGAFLRGDVRLAGQDVASGERVEANLSHVVPLTVTDADLASRTDRVVLRLSTVGVPLGSADAPVVDGRALIDPGAMRLIAAGKVTGEIELQGDGTTIARGELPFRETNPWFLTAMGLASLLVLLIAFANLESSLKPLLRGRRRRMSRVSAPVWGAMIGVGLVLLSASVSISEITLATVIVCAVLGAGMGYTCCSVAAGRGRRRRLRRALKRAERSMSQEMAAA